eukprot:GHVS01105841.1.p1 GENE.GHVS01105841.1~~GHVS01105841.1.p1  ORF type:complete len:731 (+),score=107.57 GHVS01105841.1:437-2629(+)
MGDTISSCCAVESADASKQTVKISNPRSGTRQSSNNKLSSRRAASIDTCAFSGYRESSSQAIDADGSDAAGAIQLREDRSRSILPLATKPPRTQGSALNGETVVISYRTKADLVDNEDLSDSAAEPTGFMLIDYSEVTIGLENPAVHHTLTRSPAECSPKAIADEVDQSAGPAASISPNGLALSSADGLVRAPVVPDDYEQMDSTRSGGYVNGRRDVEEQRDTVESEGEGNGRTLAVVSRRIEEARTERRKEDEENAACSYCCSECNNSMVESSSPLESDKRCSSCSPCVNKRQVTPTTEGDKMWRFALIAPGNEEHQRSPSVASCSGSSHCSETASRSSCVTFSMDGKDSTREQHTPDNISANKRSAFSPSSPEYRPNFHTAPASDTREQALPQGSSHVCSPSPSSAASFPSRLQSADAHSPSVGDHSGSQARPATEGCSNPSFYFTPPNSGGSSARSIGGVSPMIVPTVTCTPPATPLSANGGEESAVIVPPVPTTGSSDDRPTLVGGASTAATSGSDTKTETYAELGGDTESEAADQRNTPSGQTNAGDDDTTSAERKEEVTSFRHDLLDGVGIIVLLQDGTRLLCQLTLSMTKRTLSIRCNEKVRILNVSDIQNLLYGRRELRKVETKANIKNDKCCVALHLVGSGNCIPLHFETPERAMMFVDIVQHLKLTNNTAAPSLPSDALTRQRSSQNSTPPSPSAYSSSSAILSPVANTDLPSVTVTPNC